MRIWVEGVVEHCFWEEGPVLEGSFLVGGLLEGVGFVHWRHLVGVHGANLGGVQNLVEENLVVNLGSSVGVDVAEVVLWAFLHLR